jgi:pyruvate/2-oxoglutarate dehydrogenase complex dihydrolipoamide dehydrogenase (E3) component
MGTCGRRVRKRVEFDLVVIGGGAAGLAAARTARRRGATVAVVSDGPFGGDCTHVGCVPSKTLIEAAAAGLDFTVATRRLRATVARIAASEDAAALDAEGITAITATATLTRDSTLSVDGRPLAWRRLVVATGTTAVLPPIPGLAGVGALTNETAFELTRRPDSLLVVGGGPIGVELAQAFARFGTTVTLIESAVRLLPREEPEASAAVARALHADGVGVRTGQAVRAVSGDVGAVTAKLADGTPVTAERLLVAVGRRPVTDRLGLADTPIRLDSHGYVVTDSRLRTSLPGVYAAGDVTGRAPFTHAADEMGRIAALNALSPAPWHRFREDAIPHVTYTRPEVAAVGLTEAAAARAHPDARVAELPLDELDRALTAGHTDGYIKLIAAPRTGLRNLAGGRLVGATIVAARAGEMIALPTLALRTAMFPARLALTVQAYPTWTLGVRQTAAQFFVPTNGRRARPAHTT